MAKISNLWVRAISGVILVALLVTALLYSSWSAALILAIIAIGCQIEIISLARKKDINSLYWFPILISLLIWLPNIVRLLWLSPIGDSMIGLNPDTSSLGNILLTIAAIVSSKMTLVMLFVVRGVIELYRNKKNPLSIISVEIMSVIYPALLLLLTSIPSKLVLALFIMVWSNDVGAYLVGSKLGRRKLFERISPKKSWEGFFGGIAFSILAAMIAIPALSKYTPIEFTLSENYIILIITGIIVSVAATFGDLFESMLKRAAGVKDSGNTIPGHGGFLDRFDAVLFAAPCFYCVFSVIAILL